MEHCGGAPRRMPVTGEGEQRGMQLGLVQRPSASLPQLLRGGQHPASDGSQLSLRQGVVDDPVAPPVLPAIGTAERTATGTCDRRNLHVGTVA